LAAIEKPALSLVGGNRSSDARGLRLQVEADGHAGAVAPDRSLLRVLCLGVTTRSADRVHEQGDDCGHSAKIRLEPTRVDPDQLSLIAC